MKSPNKITQLIWSSSKYLMDPVQSERGNAFVLSTVMGLLLISGSTIALCGAMSTNNNTSSNDSQKQAMGVSEGGFTRYLDFLNKFPQVAVYCANAGSAPCDTGVNWANITDTTNFASGSSYCTTTTSTTVTSSEAAIINAQALTAWKTFESDSDYRLVSYTYQPDGLPNTSPGTGTLIVEGRNDDTASGITRMEFSIPITENTNGGECPIPGIWAQSTGTVKVSPHANGSINAIVRKTGSAPSTGDFVAGSLHGANIYDGVTAPSSGATTMTMPSIPSSVSSPTAPFYTIYSTGNATAGYLDLSSTCTIRLPRKVGNNAWGEDCPSTINSSFNSITSGNEDQPHADGRYYYVIPSDTAGDANSNSLKLSGASILIEPGTNEKVVIYVKGKIDLSATFGIDDDDAVSYDSAGNYVSTLNSDDEKYIALSNFATRDPNAEDASGYGCELTSDSGVIGSEKGIKGFINQGSTANLEMYGPTSTTNTISNGRINAFMLFPNATFNVSQGLLSGAIWAESFDFSNSSGCTVGLVQNKVGNVLAASTSYPSAHKINTISSLQRKPVP